MNFLIVVDMQNDFISGSLGSAHAAAIVPNVVKKVSSFDGTVIYTRDTHGADYMYTQEGEKLPIIHCTKDTPGWEICNELKPYVETVVDKPTFGCVDLPRILSSYGDRKSTRLNSSHTQPHSFPTRRSSDLPAGRSATN